MGGVGEILIIRFYREFINDKFYIALEVPFGVYVGRGGACSKVDGGLGWHFVQGFAKITRNGVYE